LDFKKVNDIDIENENEIIESLKGSKYEIDVEEEEDKYFEIEQQMLALYNNGDIYDSEYTFGSLFSLEFDDDEFGSYFVDWHYSKNLFTNAKRHYDDSDYEKAIKVLQKYIAFEDKKEGLINGLRLIAESYEELEDYTNAVHFYDKVIKLDSSNDYYFAHKGYCLEKEKKYSEAEEAFRAAINLNPQNIYAITYLADCLVETNQNEEALSILNKGIEDNPTQPPKTTSRFWLFQQKACKYFFPSFKSIRIYTR
jgi:tetratricopeptide (TPR) repeat protein